ncbi:MAG: hypothetical protein JNM21_09640 [Taibaiella sp.]|nr:hypothetical protein [Taibaiella sp.]
MLKLRKLRFLILFIIPFLYAPEAYVQVATILKQGDTLNYTVKSRKATWLEVSAPEANLVIGYYTPDGKWQEQDLAPAIGSVERLLFDPKKAKNPVIKIWPAAYLEQARDMQLLIREQPGPGRLATAFDKNEWLDDLATFKRIRFRANSGLWVYRSRQQIDSIYKWAEEEVIQHCNHIFDFYKVIVILTDFEGSCHNVTYLPQVIKDYFAGQNIYFPITIHNLNGTLVHNGVHQQIPLGAEIISVNEVTAPELIARLAKYYHSDGFSRPYKERLAFQKGLKEKYLIEFGPSTRYRVKYKSEGKENVLTLPGLDVGTFEQMQEKRHTLGWDSLLRKEKYSFTRLRQDLFQLSIRGFDFAQHQQDSNYARYVTFLDSAFTILNQNRNNRLILDLRYNTGGAGFLYEKTFSYMSDRPFRDANFAYSSFNEVPEKEALVISPFFLANGVTNSAELDVHLKQRFPVGVNGKYYLSDSFNPLVLPHKTPFKGTVFLLVDEQVASAGAHLASLVKAYTNCITIGQETCGGYYEHNGHLPFIYQLPHTGIQTGFSIVYVNQDARPLDTQLKGSGIVPDIVIAPSLDEFLKQQDAAINYILSHY